ncbi:MAG: carbohydrate-binding family 9-like protein [Fimbriimonas sp.]
MISLLALIAMTPKTYVAPRAATPLTLDGRLADAQWQAAPWTDDFVDIEGDAKPKPRFRTRAKMMWDDRYLYIGAHLEEPHVWGTLTEHDSVIFHDNDFEVFLDPDGDHHRYVELEINALNTTWDLLLVRPYLADGPPVDGFELHGLRTAVHVDGTLNDAKDMDRAWSVEIAIPWEALKQVAGVRCPPRAGDQWRINFSRVQWQHEVVDGKYRKVAGTKEDNWVWSPQGMVDMHRPDRWGVLQFAATPEVKPKAYPGLAERQTLMRAWEAQRAYRAKHGRWARTAKQLGLTEPVTFQTTDSQFEAALGEYRLDHEMRVWRVGE